MLPTLLLSWSLRIGGKRTEVPGEGQPAGQRCAKGCVNLP